MPCRTIDLSQPPYDDATVIPKYRDRGCPGVRDHFIANPIAPGDCIVVGGQTHRIVKVQVRCEGNVIWSAGGAGGQPGHVHGYTGIPVTIEFWLVPMTPGEIADCTL